MEKEKSVFDEFVGKYELSKTIQFNLVPLRWDDKKKNIVEDSEWSMLRKYGVIEGDKRIAESIKITKFYLDILHRELINNALEKLKFENNELKEYAYILQQIENNRKNKNKQEKKSIKKKLKIELSKIKDILLKRVNETFVVAGREMAKNYLININDEKNVLLTKYSLDILKGRFTQEEVNKLRLISKDIGTEYPDITYVSEDKTTKNVFDMDAGYLEDFHKNRGLLYSVKGKKGSLGKRILDNFDTFCKNKKIYEEKYKNSSIDFSEVENNFRIKLTEFFDLDFYNQCILQGDINNYAKILGGESRKQERKSNIHGLNQIINLYVQQKESEQRQEKKKKGQKKAKFNKKEYPVFTKLQKQILSQIFRKEIIIESDYDLIRELKLFLKKSVGKVDKSREIVNFFLDYEKNCIDLKKVYLPKSKINSFAHKVFKEPQNFLSVFRDGKSSLDFVSFDRIKTLFDSQSLEFKDFFEVLAKEKRGFNAFLLLLKYEIDLLIDGGETIIKGGEKESVVDLAEKKKILKEKLKWFIDKVEKDEKITDEAEGEWCLAVLAYSKAVADISRRAEIFWLNGKQEEKIGEDNKDITFYTKFEELSADEFVPFFYFDKFGSYLKSRSKNTAREIKLNFSNSDLLEGWDMNKEPEYWGFILRGGNEYYLGVGNKRGDIFHEKDGNSVKIVNNAYSRKSSERFYEKIDYKQLDIGKFEGIAFPKKTNTGENFKKALEKRANEFLDGNIEKLKNLLTLKNEYDEFKELRQKEKTWDAQFPKEKMEKLIRYYIACLKKREDWKRFELKFKNPKEYKDRDDFISHIQRQAYRIDPKPVSKTYVDGKVRDGKMFLFKIHNKDFYDFEKKVNDKENHTVNLFTQYFLELFSNENIENIKNKDLNKSIFKLDGKAEIRFRPKTDEVKLKFYQKDGKNVTYEDKRNRNERKEVVQHRRFAKDALTLHLKTRLNFGKYIDSQDFNLFVNTKLLTKVPVRILGMDRGENNLIYYCILNERGNIENGKCDSLNRVGERIKKLDNGERIKESVDYFRLLVDREERRDWEQKNWQKMTPIKDLKKGYLGNVVHWISDEVFKELDKGTITLSVLEDLSGNFKRTRFFRERQVYQEFEKTLIKKLGYMVDKKHENFGEAYQFAPIVETVEKMEKNKQAGVVIYVPASYTSKICPTPKCGWRKRFYIKNSATKESIIKLFKSNAIKVSYKEENKKFCFEYQWEQEYKDGGETKKYTGLDKVFSDVSRTRWNNNENKSIEFQDGTDKSITNELKRIFEKNNVDYLGDINKQLFGRQEELELEFFQSIVFYFNLIMQIRNYDKEKKGDDADYIQCPSCLFDSRTPEINGELSVIRNGDANGAYNIARKGFVQLCQIQKNPNEYMKLINNKEWDEAVRDWDAYTAKWTQKKT